MIEMEKEKTKTKNEQDAVDASHKALMRALAFSIQDLEANREGNLSSRQIAWVKEKRNFIAFMLPINGFVLWGATIFFTLLQVWPFAIFIGLIAALMTGYSIRRWKTYQAEVLERHVGSTQGHIELSFPFMSYDAYNLKIGELNFKLKKFGVLAFKNGEPYVVYYTPRTKKLLSAEWLREG